MNITDEERKRLINSLYYALPYFTDENFEKIKYLIETWKPAPRVTRKETERWAGSLWKSYASRETFTTNIIQHLRSIGVEVVEENKEEK